MIHGKEVVEIRTIVKWLTPKHKTRQNYWVRKGILMKDGGMCKKSLRSHEFF